MKYWSFLGKYTLCSSCNAKCRQWHQWNIMMYQAGGVTWFGTPFLQQGATIVLSIVVVQHSVITVVPFMSRLENIMSSSRRSFHWVTPHTLIVNVPPHPPKECMTSSYHVTIGSKILIICRKNFEAWCYSESLYLGCPYCPCYPSTP